MTTFEKPSLEVADVFRQFSNLLGPMPPAIWKTIQAIVNCRTSVLGGHQRECDNCGFEHMAYNSCRNRHCPKCQFLARAKWVEAREEDLLPCPYFHVVFTIPAELKPLFLRNKKVCYDILFKAASDTIKDVAANEKNLGAKTGAIGVLHTWAQNLLDHPHVHFIVPGGGLSKDESKWIPCKDDFFVSVQVLSQVFQGKLLSMLGEAYEDDKLFFSGDITHLAAPQNFDHLLLDVASKDFVVYAKEPFAGPKQVVEYLGQYTHRIAISNYRLVGLEGEMISFKVRDNDNPGKHKILTLHVKEFMRRFLLHVLPRGFVRIRHFGFLSSRAKKTKLAIIRMLLGAKKAVLKVTESWQELLERKTGIKVDKCPKCKVGTMVEKRSLPLLLNTS